MSGRKQRERRESTRARLLEATIACLVEYGHARTTDQRVQDRAGVSRGALLHHFGSKDALLVAAINHVAQAQISRLRSRAADLGDAAEGLELLREVMSGPLFLAGLELWLAARTEPTLRAALLPAEREIGRAVHELAETLFGDAAPGRAALHGLLALLRGLAMTSMLRDEPALDREILLLWVDRVLGAPGPRPGRSDAGPEPS